MKNRLAALVLIPVLLLAACGGHENPLANTRWKEVENPNVKVGELIFYDTGDFTFERFYGATEAVNMLSQMGGHYEVTGADTVKLTVDLNSANVTDESAIKDDSGTPFAQGDVINAQFTLEKNHLTLTSPRITMQFDPAPEAQ